MSEPLWVPTPESLERAEITRYLRRLEQRTGRRFDSYDELWQWSVDDLDGFWASVWDHFGLDAVSSYEAVLADDRMPGAVWFPGARLNFAERCLAAGADDDTALVLVGEGETGLNSPVEVTYGELRRQVAAVAATLRRLGVGPGDRVAGYLPNIAEAVVALLATAAVGAVWTVASPDFGTPSVLARLDQAEPVVLIAADGYRFGGKPYDRRDDGGRARRRPALGADRAHRGQPDRAGRLGPAGADRRLGRGGRAPTRRWSTPTPRSRTRCGCSGRRAPPAHPRASCTRTAGSCWSCSRRSACTGTCSAATGSSSSPRPAG